MTDYILENDPSLMHAPDVFGRTPYQLVEERVIESKSLEGFAFTAAILTRATKKLDEKLKLELKRGKSGGRGSVDEDGVDVNSETLTSSNSSSGNFWDYNGNDEYEDDDGVDDELILSQAEYILPLSLPSPPKDPVYRTYEGVPRDIAARPSATVPHGAAIEDKSLVPLFTTLTRDKLFYRDKDSGEKGEWVEDADYFGPKHATDFEYAERQRLYFLEGQQPPLHKQQLGLSDAIPESTLEEKKEGEIKIDVEEDNNDNNNNNNNNNIQTNKSEEGTLAFRDLKTQILTAVLKAQDNPKDNPFGFSIPEVDLDPNSRRAKRRELILSHRTPHFYDFKAKAKSLASSSLSTSHTPGRYSSKQTNATKAAKGDKDYNKNTTNTTSGFLGARGDPLELFLKERAKGKFL
jgi:hypothetical protein